MGCKSVTEHMGREAVRVDACLDGESLQHLMATPPRKMSFAPAGRKQIARGLNAEFSARQECVANRKIRIERFARCSAQGSQALAPALPAHMNEALARPDRGERHRHQLADT